MKELKCPICSTVLEVSNSSTQTFCPKCLQNNKRIIMLENGNSPYVNMGDGFFQKTNERKV